MKHIRLFSVAGLLALAISATGAFAESPIHLNNRLRLGYDDNIYQSDGAEGHSAKQDSFRVIEELEALLNLNMPRTYVGLRYRPSVTWYENRKTNDTELLHDLDFNLTQNFTPSLMLSLSDTLRASQLPELQDDNYIVRENDDNYYNSAMATLSYNFRPATRLDLSSRFISLTYAEEHKNDNYYSAVGGATLRQQLASRTTLMGDLRYQTLSYYDADTNHNRDASTVFAGLGAEQTFSPQLLGSLRTGVENRKYDNEDLKNRDNTGPYGEFSMTFLPTPATRITGAASYSIYESDVSSYLSQDRAYFSLSFAHDFTTKLNFYISGAYTRNSYEADYSLVDNQGDASENSYLVSARLAYRVNRINWIETGYQFVKLDSDVLNRVSYDRNRIDIGWKIQLF